MVIDFVVKLRLFNVFFFVFLHFFVLAVFFCMRDRCVVNQ